MKNLLFKLIAYNLQEQSKAYSGVIRFDLHSNLSVQESFKEKEKTHFLMALGLSFGTIKYVRPQLFDLSSYFHSIRVHHRKDSQNDNSCLGLVLNRWRWKLWMIKMSKYERVENSIPGQRFRYVICPNMKGWKIPFLHDING